MGIEILKEILHIINNEKIVTINNIKNRLKIDNILIHNSINLLIEKDLLYKTPINLFGYHCGKCKSYEKNCKIIKRQFLKVNFIEITDAGIKFLKNK